MPRRREVPKRKILPDPKFHDRMVAKFCNIIMTGGKKSTAEQIVYGAFDIIQERFKEDAIEQPIFFLVAIVDRAHHAGRVTLLQKQPPQFRKEKRRLAPRTAKAFQQQVTEKIAMVKSLAANRLICKIGRAQWRGRLISKTRGAQMRFEYFANGLQSLAE